MKQKILSLLLFGLLGITTALAQEREITGKVVDNTGGGLPGVGVLIVGTSNGTSTDLDGNFKLKAATGNVLKFTFVGFTDKEVTVGASNVINVTLEEGKQLGEVVVTGYRDYDPNKFAGSAVNVGAKQIEQIPIASFDQVLQGRVAGLQGGTGSGQPGSAANLRIRGQGSIGASSSPVYIIDGVQVAASDFATINGNDFESVTVLKDAASTSKYGSRGANGVVVARTKRGKKGQAQINYRFQQGVTMRTQTKFTNMNLEDRFKFEKMLAENELASGTTTFSDLNVNTVSLWKDWIQAGSKTENSAEYDALNERLNSLRGKNTDWTDVFFRTGRVQSHDINVSAATDKSNFYTSFQYRTEEGIIIGSKLDRYIYRFNMETRANDKLKIGINLSTGYSRNSFINSEGGLFLSNPVLGAVIGLPYVTPEDDKSSFLSGFNPAVVAKVQSQIEHQYKTIGAINADYQLTKNLTLRSVIGGDLTLESFESSIDPTDARTSNPATQNQIAFNATGNQGSMGRRYSYFGRLTSTTSLNYTKTFAEKHDVSVGVYQEFIVTNDTRFSYTGRGINPKFPNTPAGITQGTATNNFIPAVGGSQGFHRLVSTFADLEYTYDNKYTFSASIRRDGSVRFSPENRFGVFYGLGAIWNIHKETFMENLPVFDKANFRISYGEQGNQAGIPDWGYLSLYGAGGSYNGIQGLVPGAPANADIRWEGQKILNFGLDFEILKSRITGTVEFYNKISDNLFIDVQLSRTTGTTSQQRNAGKMRNRGIELNLTGDVIRTKDFTWTLNAIYTFNRNKILDLGTEREFIQGTSIVRKGESYGTHFMVDWAGVNPANGDPLYRDLEGNTTPEFNESNSVALIGKSWLAPHFGSFSNTLSYKGFEFSMLFVYEAQKYLVNNLRFFNENALFSPQFTNKDTRMLQAWTTPGQITDIPRLDAARNFSSRDVEDASFMRLRNITLAYSLPSNWLKSAKIRSLRVYALAQNMLTFTRFRGFDPENDNNIQQANYPVPRTITFGFDLGF